MRTLLDMSRKGTVTTIILLGFAVTVYSQITLDNETLVAYENFGIILYGSNVGDKYHQVFGNRQVHRAWIPPKKDTPTKEELARLFHHDAYADRIEFQMVHSDSDSYEFGEPTVASSDESVAKPAVIDYRHDVDEKDATFAIAYDCRSRPQDASPLQTVISVFVPVVNGVSVMFSLRKTCGGGPHPMIEFGVYRHRTDDPNHESRVEFVKAKGYIAGPHALSSRLYIHLRAPANTQEFFRPRFSVANPTILALSIRGPALGGVLRTGESAVLHVLYECRRAGVTRVSALVPIAPFRPLRAMWTKDCGGGSASELRIGSIDFEHGDVVQKGVPGDEWAVSASELEHPESLVNHQLHSVNESDPYIDFFLANDGEPMRIRKPIFSVDRPNTLAMVHETTALPNDNPDEFLVTNENLLLTKDHRRMRFIFVCKRRGIGHVLVTIPVVGFAPIEFGFRKHCKTPLRHRHSAFLRTANSLMNLTLVLIILVMGLSCNRLLRSDRLVCKSKNEYRPVQGIKIKAAVVKGSEDFTPSMISVPRQPALPITVTHFRNIDETGPVTNPSVIEVTSITGQNHPSVEVVTRNDNV